MPLHRVIGHRIVAKGDDKYLTAKGFVAILSLAKDRHARSQVQISDGFGEEPLLALRDCRVARRDVESSMLMAVSLILVNTIHNHRLVARLDSLVHVARGVRNAKRHSARLCLIY